MDLGKSEILNTGAGMIVLNCCLAYQKDADINFTQRC
jgi:hypothetical protein